GLEVSSPLEVVSLLASLKVQSPLLRLTLRRFWVLKTTTSSRPSWLKSATVRAFPPPAEVTGARKLGTQRSSSASTCRRVEAGLRRAGRCPEPDRHSAGNKENNMVRLLSRCGLQYNENAIAPGAQTERSGDAGPVRASLGG